MRKPPDRPKSKTPAAPTAGVSGPQNPQTNESTRNMNSIAQPAGDASEIFRSVQLIPVLFHSDTLVLVEHNAQPYVVMKPLVTAMGLDWRSQHVKLTEKFGSVMVEITTTGADGKQYQMTCLPLRKLPGWLYSINPGKLSADLRPKVIQYQHECDEVLWRHWTQQAPAQPGRIGGGESRDKYLSRSAALRKELGSCTSLGAAADAYADYVMTRTMLGLGAASMHDLAPGIRQQLLELEGSAA